MTRTADRARDLGGKSRELSDLSDVARKGSAELDENVSGFRTDVAARVDDALNATGPNAISESPPAPDKAEPEYRLQRKFRA